jgi:YfiH family protein
VDLIRPDWRAHPRVQALVTTRSLGDMAGPDGRKALRKLLPADPVWLHQVHGTTVIEADAQKALQEADAAVARNAGTVCAVMMADCMPVLLAHEGGSVVGIAHAGWRGLAAGVIEATLDAMAVAPQKITAWLGPAIGPRVYEVGDEVRVAFAGHEAAFTPTRPGHWLLDLYAVARARLARKGVRAIDGAGFCTYSDQERFFSYRRDRDSARMAALIWLA